MAKQYVFFDMDGTLIDSMHEWMNLKHKICDAYYIRTGHKISLSEEDTEKLETLSLKKAISFLNKKYHAKINYMKEAKIVLSHFYSTKVEEIEGVREFLDALTHDGIKLSVITATPKKLALIALNRLDLLKYFDFILTPEFIKGGKSRKLIFYIAAALRFTKPHNCVLIDDADYAHKTAKKVGFRTIGIYDKHRKNELKMTDKKFFSYESMLEYYRKNGKL